MKMCCPPKYPPVMVFAVYIAMALFLTLHELFSVRAVYIPGPTSVKLVGVKQCPGAENTIKLDVKITEGNETSQTVLNGRFYLPLVINDEFRVTMKEMRMEDGEWAAKTVEINNKSLCSVLDKYVWEMIDRTKILLQSSSVCPILGGDYKIEDAVLNFKDVEVPPEAVGHVKYRVVLTNEGQEVMCQEFEFKNSLKHAGRLN